MYALRRGVDGLSSGTKVALLSAPTADPVHVRTLTPIARFQHRQWLDNNGTKHSEAVEVGRSHMELEVPMDWLVLLRERTR